MGDSLGEVSTKVKLWQLSRAANDMSRDWCAKAGGVPALQSETSQIKFQSLSFVTLSNLQNRSPSIVSSCMKGMQIGRLRELVETIYVKCLAQEIIGSNCGCY